MYDDHDGRDDRDRDDVTTSMMTTIMCKYKRMNIMEITEIIIHVMTKSLMTSVRINVMVNLVVNMTTIRQLRCSCRRMSYFYWLAEVDRSRWCVILVSGG